MDAYVTKPIRSKELLRVINSVTAPLSAGLPQNDAPVMASTFSGAPGTSESSDSNGSKHDGGVLVDWQQALESLDGNRQLLGELVDIFREECPKLRAEIETALAAGDLPGLRRAAHTLKGALCHLAAVSALNLAQQVEDRAREQNLEAASALWPRLRAELDQLNPILSEFAKQPC
jgi:HPt (histidine-containing phosphotransfer) domain-containing protein